MSLFPNKYLTVFTTSWQQSLIYRAESLLWVVIDLIPIIAMVFLWLGVYRYGGSLQNYSLTSLISYYVSGYFLSRFTDTHFEENVIEQVINGTVAKYYLKPVKLFTYLVSSEIAWKILSIFLSLIPIFVIITLIFPQWLIPVSLTQVTLLFFFIIVGFLLEALFSYIIVAASFFTDQGRSFNHFKWMLFSMFNGSLLPINAYPHGLKILAEILPFKYTFAVPVQIYSGNMTLAQSIPQLIQSIFWLIVIALIAALFWNQAKNKFTSVGS